MKSPIFCRKACKRLLRWYHQRRLWFRSVKLIAFRQILPGGDTLIDEEVDMLGQLYQLAHWKVFVKYLDLQRKQLVDNGFPVAKDMMEVGEVKGNLNMCNMIEVDMKNFHEAMQERKSQKEMSAQLAVENTDEQDLDL